MENWFFNFTPEMLAQCAKRNRDPHGLFAALEYVLPRYEINTIERVAAFLAQCGHESVDFTVLQENLNYSADGLNKIFPKYFKNAGRDANAYARQPERIANVVYGGRMGNGPEASGDGWRFRGRGAIQLTGRDNYTKFAASIGYDLDQAIAYLDTLPGAIESAAWFWWNKGINAVADAGDIVTMTKLINGGTIGLEDRKKHWEHNLHVLSAGAYGEEPQHHDEPAAEDDPTANWPTLRRGSEYTDWVTTMQVALGIDPADGIFGPGTEQRLREWQAANGLTADGIAGRATLKKLLGY